MTDIVPFMSRKERKREDDMAAYMDHFNTSSQEALKRLNERLSEGRVDSMMLVYAWNDDDGEGCTTRYWCVPTIERAALMSMQAQVAVAEIQDGARDCDEEPEV